MIKKPVICFGELIIDFVAGEKGKSLAEVRLFRKNPGGAPANVAVGLHFHHIPVLLWSKVGKDSFGQFLKAQIKEIGLPVDGISEDPLHPTKLALVGIREDGDRYFEFHNLNSAEQYIKPADLDMKQLENASVFHFGGVALLGEVTARTTFQLLPIARKSGCLVSFDPNIRLDLCKNSRQVLARIQQVIRFVDILKMSREEYEMVFSGTAPLEILSQGISLLVITEGAQGCRLVTRKFDVRVASQPVEAIDTTGAGDAFTAAMLAFLLKNPRWCLSSLSERRLREIAEFANRWAGKIVQHQGAISAYLK